MRHVLLLAGGQGKRFWPRSRSHRPKQFVSFDGRRSLLRATAERLAPLVPFARQWVVTHADYVRRVRAELPEIPRAQILGEPRALNTAAAIGLGASCIQARDAGAVMLVQAADAWIRHERRFRALVAGGFAATEARRGVLLIGFRPSRPATGYGYIETGARLRLGRGLRVFAVADFKEKPTAATARRYLERGNYLWNGCMFIWHAETILAGIREHIPTLGRALGRVSDALAGSRSPAAAIAELYRREQPLSIEHGVVEKLSRRMVLEGDCGWEDVGTWESLARLRSADRDGNVVQGLHLGRDTRGSIVLSDSGLVVTAGLRDLLIVKDGDAVLILPRAREDELRELVAALAADRRLRRFL